ncbi:hypothetical protein SeMB42_g02630 [Synchytrium endobioticum]|uniref:Centrosomin N-terminal motif 1 domain-containing protein n=1 Tax=Synchytrium endobioticum TaxID=286115 RepID=A0A507DCI5_9FUNG|nr:hypothetical protein SeMB42_g02630 [Synchytrium endobioticum]
MGIRAEREFVDKLDMENFDLKFRLYYLGEAMEKMSPDGLILAKENAHLNTEIATLKAELDHYRGQIGLFDQQKSQFHQWSVSKDKEVCAVRAELQATQQALKEMDDRHEDLARDSEDLLESLDKNPGSREEENKLKSELEAYKRSITDLTGLVDQLQSDIVAERAEKQQSRAELKTALTQLDQEKGALLDMSCRLMERDSQLSNLHNESQAIKDEADGLRNEVACLKKAAAKKDDILRKATDMLNDINLQRDADYHALEAMRKEAQANQGELGIQNRQLKQELASEKQNNYSLIAQLELLRAKNSNDVSSARLEVESLKIQAARLNEELATSRNQHLLATQQLQALTAENACLKDTIDHSSRSNSAQAEILQAELSKLQNEVEQRSQEHRNELSKLTEEHERLLRCAEGERKAVVEARTRDLSVHEEIGTMKKQVSKAKLILKEREKMKSEVEKASQETERLRTLNTKYSQDLNELKAKLHDQERLNAASNREINALQEQIKSREEVLNRANAELTSFVQQHSSSSRTMDDAYAGQISDLQAENERLKNDLAVLRRRSAPDDRDGEPTSTWIREQNNHLQGKLQVVADQLAEKTEECTHLLNMLDERSFAHRQAVEELSERWGIEQAELKDDIALLKEERAHDIQDNEVLRSQVEDLQRLYDEREFRRQEVDEKAQQELEARQRELSAAHNEIKELEWKLEQAGQQLVLERRAADARNLVSNDDSSQPNCWDRHGVSTSVFSVDYQRKFWKLNENLRQDFCAKSKLADETAEKLRVAQSQLATTKHECNQYKRALRIARLPFVRPRKFLRAICKSWLVNRS